MMGSKVRVLVSILMTLVCLSVLSLHVALCLHYPSKIFAVTLILNPSLWLLIGLISMFCTLLLNYRDQQRKLVPAICTTSRPKNESRPSYASRYMRSGLCNCSSIPLSRKRNSSSESSVHTYSYLTDMESGSSQILMNLDSSCTAEKELQNFSCLASRSGKLEGRMAYCAYNNHQFHLYVANNHISKVFDDCNSLCSFCSGESSVRRHLYSNRCSKVGSLEMMNIQRGPTNADSETHLVNLEENLIDLSPVRDGEVKEVKPETSFSELQLETSPVTEEKHETSSVREEKLETSPVREEKLEISPVRELKPKTSPIRELNPESSPTKNLMPYIITGKSPRCSSKISSTSGDLRKDHQTCSDAQIATTEAIHKQKLHILNGSTDAKVIDICTCPLRYRLKHQSRTTSHMICKTKPSNGKVDVPFHLFEVKKEEQEKDDVTHAELRRGPDSVSSIKALL